MSHGVGRWIGQGLLFALLTLLTQIGGLAQLVALALPRGWRLAGFAAVYLLLTLAVVPPLAGLAGRARLPCLQPEAAVAANPLVCLLNRGYLTPEAKAVVRDVGEALAARFPGSRVTPLEAGFPFLPGFPLLPHITHRDGRAVDLAFLYRLRDGTALAEGSPSPLGYFVVEPPRAGEADPCGAGGWARLRFGIEPEERDWLLDEVRTAFMLRWLAQEPRVRRLLLETHLHARLGVMGGKVRFQGCRAARHDDHVHVDLRQVDLR